MWTTDYRQPYLIFLERTTQAPPSSVMTNLNVNSPSNCNFKEVKKISQNNQLLKQIKTTYLGGKRKKPVSEATNTNQSFKKIKIEESSVLLNESNIQNFSENLIKSYENCALTALCGEAKHTSSSKAYFQYSYSFEKLVTKNVFLLSIMKDI